MSLSYASPVQTGGYIRHGARAWRWFLSDGRLVVAEHDVSHVGGHVYQLTRRMVGRPSVVFAVLGPNGLEIA